MPSANSRREVEREGINRRNLTILAAVMFVVTLGFGMVMPIFPFYIESMGASGTELGLLLAISPIMQILFSPFWGTLSDAHGRKPILAVGILGYAISLFLYGLATQLWMLFSARAVGSVLSSATTPTTYAYVGDSTSAEERGGGIGFLGAAMGLGVIFGPAFGGWLAGDSLSTPFFVTAGLALLTLLLLLRFLPESLPSGQRSQDPGAGTSSPGTRLRRNWREWRRLATGPAAVLLFMAVLVSFALTNFQGIFGLYALRKFGYGTERVGWILTTMGGVAVVAQGVLAGPLTKHWGERPLIQWTLLASAATFLFLLLADTFATVLLATALFTLPNALLRLAVIALTSKVVPEQQGVLMGLSNSSNNVGRAIAPIWAGFVFDIDINYPYLSGALIMFVGFLVGLKWLVVPDGVDTSEEEPAGPPTAFPQKER